jgi:hypothetical protein
MERAISFGVSHLSRGNLDAAGKADSAQKSRIE